MHLLELGFWIMPPGSEALLIAMAGLLLMVGVVSRAQARSFLVGLVLFLLLEPFLISFIMSLPLLIQVLVTVFFWLMLLGAISRLLFGRWVTRRLKERFLLWAILAPFRLTWWVIRGLFRLVFPPRHRQREVVVLGRPAQHQPRRRDEGW